MRSRVGREVDSFAGLQQLTHINDGIEPSGAKPSRLNWKNDGLRCAGMAAYPANYDPAKKYGLIVLVHGGPAAAAQSSWGGRGQLERAGVFGDGILCAGAESARELWAG